MPSEPPEPEELLVPTRALSSLDEVLIPPVFSPSDDQEQYQDLLGHMVTALNLMVEDVKDPQDEFLDILQSKGMARIALPIHKAILQSAQTIWHVPASCTPTPKHMERCYFVPAKDTNFLCIHPLPNAQVV